MQNTPREINIELGGALELDVFYEVNAQIGLNILCIYHNECEISHYLNFYAISDIKTAIWEAIK